MRAFSPRDFGAVGDGLTDDTAALSATALACRDAGGGILRVPAGVYLTGIVRLYSRTTLVLERGATLLGSPDIEKHRHGDAIGGILFAQDAEHVRIEGEGTLDGNAPHFFHENELHAPPPDFDAEKTHQGCAYGSSTAEHGPLKPKARPGNLVVFSGCNHVAIEGIRVTGATYWTLHLADCEDVLLRGLRIENDSRHPNNDGVHLTTCRRALIEDCIISTGDDCIAVTGFRHHGGEREIALGLRDLHGVCAGVLIRRCELSSRSSAIRLGYGQNPLRDVTIEDVIIRDTNRGICICARQAPVSYITIRRVNVQTRIFHGNWWGRAEPLHVTTVRFWGDPTLHPITHVNVEDFTANGENGIHLYSEDPHCISQVRLARVDMTLRKDALFDTWGGNIDLRPAANRAIALHAGGQEPLFRHNVDSLEIVGGHFCAV